MSAADHQSELDYLRQRVADLEKENAAQSEAMGRLHTQEQRYRGLIESQHDLIVRTGRDGRFSFVNDAYCQALGKPREEVLGQSFADFIYPEDLPAVIATVEALHDPPHRTMVENRVPTRDGWRWYAWESSIVWDEAGNIVETQAIGRDISAYKQALEDLEHALRLKDEFLATMSHELRTPLNVVLGMTEVLQSALYGTLTDKQYSVMATIESSGRHLLAMINDILDLSKIEAGKETLTIKPVAIVPLCRSSVEFVQQEAGRKRITFVQSIDPGVTTMPADERRLRQILLNLLNNAVKFTPEGGQVGLEVTTDEQQQSIVFTVWDTGIGIAPEHMQRIFQPFVQIDSGLSRQHGGTGLGLALVARLVELHGGDIAVTSNIECGSRFMVTLPRQPVHALPAPPEPPPVSAPPSAPQMPELINGDAPSDRPTLLLVEDHGEMATVLQEYLTSRGYHVSVARTGREALAQMQAVSPALILMDVHLPEMDGLEVIQRLRANPEWTNLPIIALTALAMPGDQERCLSAGANDYISKPVRLETLRQIIAEYLGTG
ncbi:MAG: ATP-binding protein [Chloroflexaceae bacterium]